MMIISFNLSEILRMYCPLDSLVRIANDDYKISGTDLTIEKNSLVLVPVYAIQHDENFFPDPDKFDPERFSDDRKDEINPMAYIPFGESRIYS